MPLENKLDKFVLITGASSGIGFETAKMFAEKGFKVFGTSRKELPGNNGIEMFKLDVRSDDAVKQCIEQIFKRTERVDVLINNAGTWHVDIAEETTMEEAHKIFETNFFGTVRMINALLPSMRNRREGQIINVGSMAAWIGEPGESFYSASKHALAGYTESLHHEVKHLGIKVSLVEPGAFKTNFLKGMNIKANGIEDYNSFRSTVQDTLLKSLEQGDDPRKAAQLLLKIVCSNSPLLRYGAGKEAHWLPYFKLLLPQKLIDKLVSRGFNIPKNKLS